MIARDEALERHLLAIACRAAGVSGDAGLGAFAASRAWPGGIRPDIDAFEETRQEIGDGVNYTRFGIQLIYPLVVAGETDALDRYSMLMGGLKGLVGSWHDLHRVPS